MLKDDWRKVCRWGRRDCNKSQRKKGSVRVAVSRGLALVMKMTIWGIIFSFGRSVANVVV